MRLRVCRDNGTIAIPFRIEKRAQKFGSEEHHFRVIFAWRYAVDLFSGFNYSDCIHSLQITYNCANLNFDTVELC